MSQDKIPNTYATGLDLVTAQGSDTDLVLFSGIDNIVDVDGVSTVSVVYNTSNNISATSGALSVPTTYPSATYTLALPQISTTYFLFADVVDSKFGRTSLSLGSVTIGSFKTLIGRGAVVTDAVVTESSKATMYSGAPTLFNGVLGGATTANVSFPHWYQVMFPEQTTVKKYRLWADPTGSDPVLGDTPKNWTFEGTNDINGLWTVLDTRGPERGDSAIPSVFAMAGVVTTAVPHGEYVLSTPATYMYYRILITDTLSTITSRTVCRIGEMELIG